MRRNGGTRRAFIAAELEGEDRRSVARNILVAAAFRPGDIAKHGAGKLEEIALYLREKAGAREKLGAIDLARVTIDVPHGHATRAVAGPAATIEQVRAARRALGKRGAAKKKASPRRAAVRKALGARQGLRAIALREGKDAVTFGAVPLARSRHSARRPRS